MRKGGWVLTALLLSGCAGLRGTGSECYEPSLVKERGWSRIDFAQSPEEDLVQLCSRRSFHARRIAIHQWFLVYDASEQRWETWELWPLDTPGGAEEEERWVSIELAYSSDGSPPREVRSSSRQWGCVRSWQGLTVMGWPFEGLVMDEWRGEAARRLIDVLREPRRYPGWDDYRLWPGPNSNAYITWALRKAWLSHDPHPLAVGKDFIGLWGFGFGLSPTLSGLQLDTPIVGAKAGLLDGVELHLLQLTLGVDLWPPAFKTPLGRFGFRE